MATQPPDPNIEHLLAELRSADAKRRQAAAERIARLRIQNDDINQRLKAIAASDSDWYAKYAAQNALSSLAKPPSTLARLDGPLSRRAKIVEFSIGCVLWYAMNGLIWFLAARQPGFTLQGNGIESYGAVGLLIWPANIVGLIMLAVIRPLRWVALGVLSAMALNFLVALMIGVSIDGYCFIPFFTAGVH